jgi:ppGpp synthetase/RelA/SpoT-type nucleotidyltranferase
VTSSAQADRLGDRVRESVLRDEDIIEFDSFRRLFEPALLKVEEALRHLALPPTSRLKTTGAIVDKLRRDRTRLSTLQDIAGTRVVKSMSLTERNALVEQIVQATAAFGGTHVVARIESRQVEIQVRTADQDLWAVFEEITRHLDVPAMAEDAAQRIADLILGTT